MEQETKKRIRRSRDEVNVAKIEKLKAEIKSMEAKIASKKKEIEILESSTASMSDVKAKIKELGLSNDDVIKLLEKGKK